jgi:hypothetical protein
MKSNPGTCVGTGVAAQKVWVCAALLFAAAAQALLPAATWGPNSNGECDTMLNSTASTTDNHHNTANNVGKGSTSWASAEGRPCFHWNGSTGTLTPLNPDIDVTGGTFTDTINAAYSATLTARVSAYILTSDWPWNSYRDGDCGLATDACPHCTGNQRVTWIYRDWVNCVPWTTAGGDSESTALTTVSVVDTGSYSWTWSGGTHKAGYGIIMKISSNRINDINYRKTFRSNASGKASLTLTYTPPSGEANSCVQNWNAIGTWADTDTTLATDLLAQNSTDPRGVSEAEMAARTGASYNGQSFAASSQNNDQFDAATYGWGASCSGYGFVYVYYNHADNAAVYLGAGVDDRSKIWLNGTAVRSYTTAGTWEADRDFYGTVTLKQGWNRVLIKAQNSSTSPYAWSLRFAKADRSALGDCTFYLTDSTAPSNPSACTDASGSANNTWQKTVAAPNFTWSGAGDTQTTGEGVSGVKGYRRYWGTDPNGTSDTQVTASAAYNPGAVTDGAYYLRVATYDYALNEAAWQTLYTFKYDSTPPADVSMGFGTITTDSITVTGAGTDPSSGVNSASGYNYSRAGAGDSGAKGTSHTWTGLAANTEYSGLYVTISDQVVPTPNMAASSPQKQWTLSIPPTASSVVPDSTTACAGSSITWTAAGGFGAGRIQKYKYAWDQNPTHSWAGAEADWTGGTLQTTPTAAGAWYLHAQGYNGANVANGSYDYPVGVNPEPAAASLAKHRFQGASLKISVADLTPDSIQSVGPAAHGTVSASSTYLIYEPTSGDNNNDSFTYTAANGYSCTKQATVNIIVDVAASGAATVSWVNGKPTIQFAGIPACSYTVERDTDVAFSSPTPVLATNAPSQGLFIFVDNDPPESGAYYRLRYQP